MRRIAGAIAALAWFVVSCSLIVTNDVPAYHCTGQDPASCPTGLVCNAAKQLCVTPGVIDTDTPPTPGDPLGQPDGDTNGGSGQGADCSLEADCQTGLLCANSSILGTTIVPSGTRSVCTKPCCTSADCADGFVCFSAGTGGNYCVAGSRARRSPAGAGKPAGAACGADTECRSGLCGGTVCVDTCCAQSDCANGTVCQVSTTPDHIGWNCAPPLDGGSNLGEACVAPSDCKNDLCVTSTYPNKKCSASCCSANDCNAQGFPGHICAYGRGTQGEALKWCYTPGPGIGSTDAGAHCNVDEDCRTRLCDRELGVCAVACCTNDDCGPNEACRPSPVDKPLLRCVAILR